MDRETLKKAAIALAWEHRYMQKAKQDDSISGYFLAMEAEPDPDFSTFFDQNNIQSVEILDIGTGTGELAIHLAQRGFQVTAIDASAAALALAKKQAEERGVSVNFITDNILLTGITQSFDLITDRGCVTILPFKSRSHYFKTVYQLLRPDGWLLIKADRIKNKKEDILDPGPDFQLISQRDTVYFDSKNRRVPAIFYVLQKAK